MNATITRDIVLDLWPAYEAGEASPDTRAVIEAYLVGDPQLAAVVRKVGAAVRGHRVPGPDAADERRVVEATRRRLGRQRWLAAGAILTTLLPLSFRFSAQGGPDFWFGGLPLAVGALLMVAVILWGALWRATRP
jgi:anti-sigma factor RsiW